jgi:oligopeptide transport system permease protein
MELRRRTFIQAANSLGQSHLAILRLHLFPNLLPTLVDYALLLLPNAILMEAFLSFLGLGIQPPRSSWGIMVVEGIQSLHAHPLQLFLPAGCLILTLLALTTLRRPTPP